VIRSKDGLVKKKDKQVVKNDNYLIQSSAMTGMKARLDRFTVFSLASVKNCIKIQD